MIDTCLPSVIKPSLQQYDNYQIYDIGCVDTWRETTQNNQVLITDLNKKLAFLAVQAYHVSPIQCNFIQIMEAYK